MNRTIVEVRGIRIGEGRPKICVPLTGENEAALLEEIAAVDRSCTDLLEWRADCFGGYQDSTAVLAVLKKLREAAGSMPLIFTFRSREEGGSAELSMAGYMNLYKEIIPSELADIVDIEYSLGDEYASELLWLARRHNVVTILSSHNFEQTGKRILLMERLHEMQILGGDILKLAVMPKEAGDVLTLMRVTFEMSEYYARGPIVTMSMSQVGTVSRLCGEVFGSAITFASGVRASAPGQIPADKLKVCLDVLHMDGGRND
ncbi:type I 3-dehydroquinate dehydratase [Anaerolentibacter hominis]|uniref:type I 3-dehydroquinate dehydratase n=1 Tax=Anaerolentibacter hominis TaxID=3079009 RepID=UPI0031B89B98